MEIIDKWGNKLPNGTKHGVYREFHKNGFMTKKYWDFGVLMKTYRHCPQKINFKSKMVNDMNQNHCGGWGSHVYDLSDEALVKRTLDGLKPLSATSGDSLDESIHIDRDRFFCCTVETGTGWKYIAVAPKGKLRDLFDLETLREDYKANGYGLDTDSFADDELQDYFTGWDVEDIGFPLAGLILGYPIENTISLMRQFEII